MRLACIRAGFVLQQRAAGLTAAAGLFLEEHLAGCTDCRGRANLLTQLQLMHELASPALGTGARERAIQSALLAARPKRSVPPVLQSSRWVVLVPTLAAAALAVAYGLHQHRAPAAAPHAAPIAANATPARIDRVLSGRLQAASGPQVAGDAIASGEWLSTDDGAALSLAHAKVELRSASTVRWRAQQRALQLGSGSVEVDVDPTPHERFEVHTEHFHVIVLGTHFQVSTSEVTVQRGRVSVRSPSGQELALLDGNAHKSWRWVAPDSESDQSAVPAQPEHSASAIDAPARQRSQRTATGVSVDALLAQARKQIVARDVTQARHTLDQLDRRPIAGPQRAEALSLRAECALVSGEFRAARVAYLKVSNEFANATAGETALFAAARIAAEHDSPSEARELLERYLARYPQGRFTREVRSRLRTLATAQVAP